MKTAEEALRPYHAVLQNRQMTWGEKRDNILKAMEEYAQERTKDMYPKEFVEWIYKKCILKFGVFYVSTTTGQETIKSLEDLFLHWKDNIK